MITSQELNINNRSYINKDFASIYPELVDLVRKLTSRWDPSTSNESDPGVVLMKLMAFVSDKDNYNIDKNVLERFPLSATQETSMRQLCDILGYAMGYYKAAETTVTFTYTGKSDETITLPALDTVVSDNDNTVEYRLINDAQLMRNVPYQAMAIQGSLKTLSIANSEKILLDGLDDNRRVYFPEGMVAENGVFITGGNGKSIGTDPSKQGFWDRVQNLNNQVLGSKVFKFGYDSFAGLPYVEFPEDIASIIGDGLTIRYIVTDGVDGNVAPRTLTKLLSPTQPAGTSESFDGDNNGGKLTIRNASATSNGENPESINDAYNGYKRTVGTFDTYITLRDYANAIYNIYTASNDPSVSNVQVSDRRTDPTYSSQIITYDQNGSYSKTVYGGVSAFDLILYPLNPMLSRTQESYNRSFTPLLDQSPIREAIEASKSISHDYKDLRANDLYLIKNYLKLNANIATKTKVNNYERLNIIENVKNALYGKFNARELDYGYEIPFESLLETIESADERIMTVSLSEPELTPTVMTANGDEYAILSEKGKAWAIKILAKNVLAGRVPLFNENMDFGFALGQKQTSAGTPMVLPRVKYIATQAAMQFPAGKETTYRLGENEIIQLVAPNLITEVTYPYGINYCWMASAELPANTEYRVGGTDSLLIDYTDGDDVERLYVYKKDSVDSYIVKNGVAQTKTTQDGAINIFKSSFAVKNSDSIDWKTPAGGSVTPTKTITVNGVACNFLTIGTSDAIEKRKVNQVSLTDGTPCYWVTGRSESSKYVLPWEADGTYMLKDNEYFFYTDAGKTDIVSLGSGTILRRNDATLKTSSNWECAQVSLIDILENGVSALEDYWMILSTPSDGAPLVVEETQILTLTNKDSITISNPKAGITLGNSLQPIGADKVSYAISGESPEELVLLDIGDEFKWRIKSRLDVNAGPNAAQTVAEGQKVTVHYFENELADYAGKAPTASAVLAVGEKFCLSKDLQLAGSDEIDLSETEITSEAPFTKLAYNTSLYHFTEGDKLSNSAGDSVVKVENGKINGKDSIEYSVPKLSGGMVMMLYWDGVADGQMIIEGTNCKLRRYNGNGVPQSRFEVANHLSIAEIIIGDSAESDVRVTIKAKDATVGGNLIIGKLTVFDGLNRNLGLARLAEASGSDAKALEKELLDQIATFDANGIFYYNNDYASKTIEFTDDDYMMSPYILYDTNNFYNKFTMSEIDFKNSSIDVIRSSRLQ